MSINYRNLTRNHMSGAFWRLSKQLHHLAISKGYDGLHCAAYFEDLLQQERYIETEKPYEWAKEKECFFLQQKHSYERTGLSPHKQRKVIEFLKSELLIETFKKGIPPKNFFKILHKRFHEICSAPPVINIYYANDAEETTESSHRLKNLTYEDKNNEAILNKENNNKENNYKEPVGSGKDALKSKMQKAVPSTPKNKSILPETIEIITAWNNATESDAYLCKTTKHSLSTPYSKTVYHIDKFIRHLLNGTIRSHCAEFTSDWIQRDKIKICILSDKLTTGKIIQILRIYLRLFKSGYWPYTKDEKARLPKSLDVVFYNPKALKRKSGFFHAASNPPKKAETVLDEETAEILINLYTEIRRKPSPAERVSIESASNAIVREYRKLSESDIPLCNFYWEKECGTLRKFIRRYEKFIDYRMDNEFKDMDFSPGMLRPGSVTWRHFEDWLLDQNQIVVDASPAAKRGLKVEAINKFRESVENNGLEKARKLHGERIPYLTLQKQSKLRHEADKKGLKGMEWVNLVSLVV